MFIGMCLDYFGVKLEWTTRLTNLPVLHYCQSQLQCAQHVLMHNIHYCSYNYLIPILFVYMMYTIVAVCVCVCVCVCIHSLHIT